MWTVCGPGDGGLMHVCCMWVCFVDDVVVWWDGGSCRLGGDGGGVAGVRLGLSGVGMWMKEPQIVIVGVVGCSVDVACRVGG